MPSSALPYPVLQLHSNDPNVFSQMVLLYSGHVSLPSTHLWRLWMLRSGFRGSGFGFWSFGFRVEGSGFRVQGFGFRVSGFGFRVSGLGLRFRVESLGLKVQG